jgi:type IV pilus assembly protein PilY1
MNVVRAHWYLLSVLSTNLWSADIDIYSQNAVLTAAALPLSSYIQGTNKNQVYIGMFRPDHNAPVWQGNLKLYQIALGQDNSTAILVDADGKPLIDMGSGLINSRARSFWTSGDDSPDGNMVAQGAAAQGLRDMLAAIAPTLPVLTSVAV